MCDMQFNRLNRAYFSCQAKYEFEKHQKLINFKIIAN